MKKVLLAITFSTLSLMGADRLEPDFKGFLGIQSCVENGLFADCNLKNYADGGKVIAIIDGKTYQIDRQNVSKTAFDKAIMNNNVQFYGKIEGDTLKLDNMIYDGPAKGFFKGCV